jgi:hypothetical protein
VLRATEQPARYVQEGYIRIKFLTVHTLELERKCGAHVVRVPNISPQPEI